MKSKDDEGTSLTPKQLKELGERLTARREKLKAQPESLD